MTRADAPRRAAPVAIALVLALGAGSCGAGARAPHETTTAAGGMAEEQTRGPEPAPETTDARRAEIQRLERRIGLAQNALPADETAGADASPPGAPPTRSESEPERCERACQAAASICEASRRICGLADELRDDWSRGRCTLAGRACGDAQRRSTDRCGC